MQTPIERYCDEEGKRGDGYEAKLGRAWQLSLAWRGEPRPDASAPTPWDLDLMSFA